MGMICTLVGILMMSQVGSFPLILLAAGLIGIGSSTFHPEASRVARLASGGRFGLAQSTFQVGGNAGSAFGPLLAAAIIIPFGQGNVVWFGLFALFAVIVTYGLSRWYRGHLALFKAKAGQAATHGLSRNRVIGALVVLGLLVFSKYFYMASFTSYFTFYLIEKFDLSVASSQLHLFLFLGAVPYVLWLDRVQDPGNLGTLLRTAAAVGIKQVFVSEGSVSAWSPKVLRSAQGAHFVLQVYEHLDLHALRERLRVPLVATALEQGQMLYSLDLPKACAWLAGNEGQGVDPALLARADLRVFIPQSDAVESLNVGVATAVCLYEQLRQHQAH